MTESLPRLLQPWGVLTLALLAAASIFAAYRWHRTHPGKIPLHLDAAAIWLLALLNGGFFWRSLTESNIWMPAGGGDFASFYFPTYSYVAEQIKNHTIPLWNPHLFAGMPLAADVQSAIFYPLNLLLFLFVKVDYGALEWQLIGHYWLASVFTYLFLRNLGLMRAGALAGSIVFAYSGFMVAHFGHLPMVPVATWIPLMLLCLHRAFTTPGRPGWAWAVGAGLATAMSLLAGHVQIFAYGLMAAGLLWLILLLSRGPLEARLTAEWAAKGAIMIALALALGAVQLLPSFELANQSVRASVSYEEASDFPAQPLSLLNLILPRVYGSNPTEYNFAQWQTTENWGYMGVVTLVLAAGGLVLRRTRLVAFFALLAVLAVVLMAGDLTILGGWFFKFVPGFNKLRDSGRALVLLALALAGLAAYGLDALVASVGAQGAPRRSLMWWLVGVTGFLGLLALGVMPALYKEVIVNPGIVYGRLPVAINDLGVAILWLGVVAATGWAAYRGRLSGGWAGAIILGVLVLDIFSPNSRFNPTHIDVTAGFKHFDAIATLQKQTQDPRSGIALRINSDTDVQGTWQPSTAVLPSANLYETGGAWNPLKLQRYDFLWQIAKRYPDTPLYDLTGAAFEVVSPTVGAHAGQPKWELAYKEDALQIYRDKNTLPRAFIVHDAAVEANPESIVVALRRFDVDPRHTVILQSGTPQSGKTQGTAENPNSGESVRATYYGPNSVDITVKAQTPGWLVLTDAWYPGWEATVNGQPVPVEAADYAYRAVRVPAGEYSVTMQFRPASWLWGRAISLGALAFAAVAMAVLLLWPRIRGRRQKGAPA